MTTFDVDEVVGFASKLNAQMDRCDNGEGMECRTLDDALRSYATLCRKFREELRSWGRAVFGGCVEFDPKVECAWRVGGIQLFRRALAMWKESTEADVECYVLEGRVFLQAALWDLARVLDNWVSPSLAVAPSARRGPAFSRIATEEARELTASLPPLPQNWQPYDASQQARYRQLQRS